ncbi:hypothetical protein ACFVDU_22240 [Streptomyces albidoflavus]
MANDTRAPARERLGEMVNELLTQSGLGPQKAVEVGVGDGLRLATLKNWCEGRTAPAGTAAQEALFWALVEKLEAAVGHPLHSKDDWQEALRAAQREALARRREARGPEHNSAKDRFIRAHLLELRPQGGLIGRADERSVMHSFVRDDSPQAPSYLCWQAEGAVGKTALLADYVQRPSPGVDLLNFFVSRSRGTSTRADFTEEMGWQIRTFLGLPNSELPDPRTPEEWAELFERAAARSAERDRRLVLVVDGLDEDAAWPAQVRARREQGQSADDSGSIAALLPSAPGPNLRVIVSCQRIDLLPQDLSDRHPLRLRECFRVLEPASPTGEFIEAARRAEAGLRRTALGRRVLELLAVSGGGLRVTDLAELGGVEPDQIDCLLLGVGGRCVIPESLAPATYTLGDEGLRRAVLRDLGPAGVERSVETLHAWAGTWRAAGWPEETPPYLLTGYLRLLDDPDRREAYLGDGRRQARVAATVGHDLALAQAEEFLAAGGAVPVGPESLGSAVLRAVSRACLDRQARQVPTQAPALLTRLGDADRARMLARSVPSPAVRAARLAEVAVELGRAGLPGAPGLAGEATVSLARREQVFPCPVEDTEAIEEAAGAAHALLALGEAEAACGLLRAVVLGGGARTRTFVAAAEVLSTQGTPGWIAAAVRRADDLSNGHPRAQAAAVALWATVAGTRIARERKACRMHMLDRIQTLCTEVDVSEGLGVADVLALGATALASRPVVARNLHRTAVSHIKAAMADREALTTDDQAFLRRDVSTTLDRLVRTAEVVEVGQHALEDVGKLLEAVSEEGRIGELGDDLTERPTATFAAAEERLSRETARQTKVDEKRLRIAEENKRKARNQPGAMKSELPRHRRASIAPETEHAALSEWSDLEGRPQHIALLQQAVALLDQGNPLLSRERLRAALRCSPLLSSPPPPDDDWVFSLAQALATSGRFAAAEHLVGLLPQRDGRAARYRAALSMACAHGGHGAGALRYAGEAASLAIGTNSVRLRGQVAQALAHAGETDRALALANDEGVEGSVIKSADKAQLLQSQKAIAAGLASRAPERAAQLVEKPVERLKSLAAAAHLVPVLPELTELLLTCRDVRQPSPSLSEALRRASTFTERPVQQWHPQSVVILALLEHLGCLPESARPVAHSLSVWEQTLLPTELPHAELALLRAVRGEVDEARLLAQAAPESAQRARALAAVAAHLAGVSVSLDPVHASEEAPVRRLLALAHAAGDGTPPDEPAARSIAAELLDGGEWAYAIPLLPRLAPEALEPLTGVVWAALGQGDLCGG